MEGKISSKINIVTLAVNLALGILDIKTKRSSQFLINMQHIERKTMSVNMAISIFSIPQLFNECFRQLQTVEHTVSSKIIGHNKTDILHRIAFKKRENYNLKTPCTKGIACKTEAAQLSLLDINLHINHFIIFNVFLKCTGSLLLLY